MKKVKSKKAKKKNVDLNNRRTIINVGIGYLTIFLVLLIVFILYKEFNEEVIDCVAGCGKGNWCGCEPVDGQSMIISIYKAMEMALEVMSFIGFIFSIFILSLKNKTKFEIAVGVVSLLVYSMLVVEVLVNTFIV